jgi:hypothetical protein
MTKCATGFRDRLKTKGFKDDIEFKKTEQQGLSQTSTLG